MSKSRSLFALVVLMLINGISFREIISLFKSKNLEKDFKELFSKIKLGKNKNGLLIISFF